ncbi:molybdopterin-dependent oxidoreductase [Oceanimonas baumannii]|uniref:molybdopterin-dependent oxidoreductase n=1 Tax=Oceanimonas baumannii TaxID=129578 RepID=UPI001D190678|nr:molybdopterin-dependent oxidoreductase [Oceanimonas baumannii]MCC4262999.1 molybdopterin-dependent oxidoreductase [Oceanimonas baumannii]
MRAKLASFLGGIMLWLMLAGVAVFPVSAAEPLLSPQHPVVLTVTGEIHRTNSDEKALFDLSMLDKLPQQSFTTDTPWTERKHLFSGVLLSELLKYVGAEGKTVRVVALNDYHVDIDIEVASQHPLLLATRMDGETMKIRDKGPIWLMLPLSDNKSYDTKRYHELLAWQLKTLDIR